MRQSGWTEPLENVIVTPVGGDGPRSHRRPTRELGEGEAPNLENAVKGEDND